MIFNKDLTFLAGAIKLFLNHRICIPQSAHKHRWELSYYPLKFMWKI